MSSKKSRKSGGRIKWSLLLAIAVGVYVIGENIYSSKSASEADAAEKTVIKADDGSVATQAKHFEGLDRVVLPKGTPSQEKDYEGFRVSFNRDNRTPNWVAWELLGTETEGEKGRTNQFWLDDEIEECPSTDDYKHSGYDRGHLCPAADQKWSARAMEDCFVMANMCPQDHSLNSGAWNTLENKERTWARRDSAIMIVAGPIYEASDKIHIGQKGVRVPGAFFKVIVAPYLDEPRGIAFVYPNMSSPGNMENYMLTIDEVEKLTGYDFFAALPDEIENKIEASSSFKEWNRRK